MGTQSPSQRLTQWIRATLADLTDDGPVARLDLRHVIPGEEEHPRIATFKVDYDAGIDPDALAMEIYSTAEDDSKAYDDDGRPQRYAVIALRPDSEEGLHHIFTIKSKSLRFALEGSEGGHDERGLLGQLMRHQENSQKVLMTMIQATTGHLSEELAAERTMRMAFEQKLRDQAEAFQTFLDREQERDLKRMEFESRQAHKAKLMGMVTQAVPMIMHRISSGPKAPAATVPKTTSPSQSSAPKTVDPVRARAAALFTTLGKNPERMTALIGELTDEEQQAIIALYQECQSSDDDSQQESPTNVDQSRNQGSPAPSVQQEGLGQEPLSGDGPARQDGPQASPVNDSDGAGAKEPRSRAPSKPAKQTSRGRSAGSKEGRADRSPSRKESGEGRKQEGPKRKHAGSGEGGKEGRHQGGVKGSRSRQGRGQG